MNEVEHIDNGCSMVQHYSLKTGYCHRNRMTIEFCIVYVYGEKYWGNGDGHIYRHNSPRGSCCGAGGDSLNYRLMKYVKDSNGELKQDPEEWCFCSAECAIRKREDEIREWYNSKSGYSPVSEWQLHLCEHVSIGSLHACNAKDRREPFYYGGSPGLGRRA